MNNRENAEGEAELDGMAALLMVQMLYISAQQSWTDISQRAGKVRTDLNCT